jgi:hypothetical protein
MVQNPKGGGLSSSLGGSQMLGGVQKTTDFLRQKYLGASRCINCAYTTFKFELSWNDG